jgi:heme exporter protein C
MLKRNLPWALIALGSTLLVLGSYLGLFRTPGETYMGDVQRIMYVHVPTAWNALLAFTYAFVCGLFFLIRGGQGHDAHLEAALEVGVVLSLLLCAQGAIWARPTWGVYWDWDPRLTTTAIMCCAFAGILALRSFVGDSVKRATWSSVATIVSYVNVPLVYFSVRWWNSLHQVQSSPATVSRLFILPLRINAFGVLFLMLGLLLVRARVAQLRQIEEMAPPLPERSVPSMGGAR